MPRDLSGGLVECAPHARARRRAGAPLGRRRRHGFRWSRPAR